MGSNRAAFRDASSAVEESVIHLLASKGRHRQAKQMLRSLLSGPARTADLDERLALSCFPSGLPELGAAFAGRAARTLHGAGEIADAARVLSEAEKACDACGSKTLMALAEVRVDLGWIEDAARLMVRAADRAREEGQPLRALESCLRASHLASGSRGLHRAWGLALLALGDVDGASGHLEHWCEEEPCSIEPLLWALNAQCGRRATVDCGPLLERLVERLGVREAAPSEATLREHILERLRAAPLSTTTPGLSAFWESEELRKLLASRTYAGRSQVRVPVDLAVELDAEGGSTLGRAENLSCWGVRLRSARPLALDTQVMLRFRLGLERSQLALAGRVTHCSPSPNGDGHRVGVFFFALEPAQLELLRAEVERRLDGRSEPADEIRDAG